MLILKRSIPTYSIEFSFVMAENVSTFQCNVTMRIYKKKLVSKFIAKYNKVFLIPTIMFNTILLSN